VQKRFNNKYFDLLLQKRLRLGAANLTPVLENITSADGPISTFSFVFIYTDILHSMGHQLMN
jgi:hypothetical protein